MSRSEKTYKLNDFIQKMYNKPTKSVASPRLGSIDNNVLHHSSEHLEHMESRTPLSEQDIEYKTMGELEPGDELISSDGSSTFISEVYEEHVPESMYELRFMNGEVFEASGNHLWYTVNMLDNQLHKERIKRAKNTIVEHISKQKLDWVARTASIPLEDSPAVDISFIFEMLNIVHGKDLVWSITRTLESIGPVAIRNEKVYDEEIESTVDNRNIRLYSLSLFCQQLLALYAEAANMKDYYPYDLLKGKVRTTEEIAFTQELNHDFPTVRIV